MAKDAHINHKYSQNSLQKYDILIFAQKYFKCYQGFSTALGDTKVTQAARRWATGWTARVRFQVSEGWRFFFTPSCPDWSWGPLNLQKMSTGDFPRG